MSNGDSPVITVIVPCYNVGQYIVDCVNSILMQTFRNFEVLCIDDGSADETCALLHELAAKDERVSVIEKSSNGGLYLARLTGIERARGDYVTFVDADDALNINHLEALYARAAEGCEIAVGAYERIDVDGSREIVVPVADTRSAAECLVTLWSDDYKTGLCPCWNKLYRLLILKNVPFIYERVNLGEDQFFNAQVFAAFPDASVGGVFEPTYKYIQRYGSLIKTVSVRHVSEFFYVSHATSHLVLRAGKVDRKAVEKFQILAARKLFDLYGIIFRSRNMECVTTFSEYLRIFSYPSYVAALKSPILFLRLLKYVFRREASRIRWFPAFLD